MISPIEPDFSPDQREQIYRRNLPTSSDATTLANTNVTGLARKVFYAINQTANLPLLHVGTNLLAVEMHLSSPSNTDSSFHLELDANVAGSPVVFPPQVAITQPAAGLAPVWYKLHFDCGSD